MAFQLRVNRQVGSLRITLSTAEQTTPNQNQYRLNRVLETGWMSVAKISVNLSCFRTELKRGLGQNRLPKEMTTKYF